MGSTKQNKLSSITSHGDQCKPPSEIWAIYPTLTLHASGISKLSEVSPVGTPWRGGRLQLGRGGFKTCLPSPLRGHTSYTMEVTKTYKNPITICRKHVFQGAMLLFHVFWLEGVPCH